MSATLMFLNGDVYFEYDPPSVVKRHHEALTFSIELTLGQLDGAWLLPGGKSCPITGQYDFDTNCWTVNACGRENHSCQTRGEAGLTYEAQSPSRRASVPPLSAL